MNTEQKNARYFGGEKVNGHVFALNARTFDELIEECVRQPVALKITKAEFWEMPKAERQEAKRVPYLVAATFRDSPSPRQTENALACNLILLDLDEEGDGSCPAAQFVNAPDSLAAALAPFAFAAYTTASSTPEKPRMRVIVSADGIPLKRYAHAVLNVAHRMGLKKVTTESKTPVQPMFRPTIFSDEWFMKDPLVIAKAGRDFCIADLNAQTDSKKNAEDEAEDSALEDWEHYRPRDKGFSLALAQDALKSVNADAGYYEWLKVAAALKHQFSDEQDEEAYQIFDAWSATGLKYAGEEETRAKWDSLKQSPKGQAPITIGTLIKMAESGGWKKPKQTNDKAASVPDFGPCLVHARELVTMNIPKRARLLDQWLCEGDLGYIFAARGVGKTWMSMALLGAISQGCALGAWTAGEKQCKVLYIDGEMPLELTKERTLSLDLENGDVTFLHHETVFDGLGVGLNIAQEDHRFGITRLIESKGFGVLVLDNLSALACGLDENKGDEYDPVKAWLLELRRRKVTVIAKTDGDEGAKFTSHFAKASRNTGDSLPVLLWHITTSEKKVSIKCEEAALDEFQQFIRHVFEGVESQKEIAELMGKQEGTISKWAKKAVEEGAIRKDGKRLRPLNNQKTAENLDETDEADLW